MGYIMFNIQVCLWEKENNRSSESSQDLGNDAAHDLCSKNLFLGRPSVMKGF